MEKVVPISKFVGHSTEIIRQSKLKESLHITYFSGEIDVTNENVQDLLIAGDMIELREVVEICTDHLARQLEPSNAIGIFRFAADHNCMLLREAALRYVCTNFVQVNF